MTDAGFLDRMAAASAERSRAAEARRTLDELRTVAGRRPPPPPFVHDRTSFDVIAEIKVRSPSEGPLSVGPTGVAGLADLDGVRRRASSYAAAGAAAISVLTEPSAFGGSLEHLEAAAAAVAAVDVPVMRKDFLVSRYQVVEARAHGAGGVLLIVRILSDELLTAMAEEAADLGMFVLVEAFDSADLERAGRLFGGRGAVHAGTGYVGAGGAGPDSTGTPVLLGLNCRDLTTLEVRPGRFAELADEFPSDSVRVAESGLGTAGDVSRVVADGYDVALIGSALMRAADPAAFLSSLITEGRNARRQRSD